MFTAFSSELLPFLRELEANNNKTWFEANKDRYHDIVLEPCRAFVEEMGEHLMALVPTIHAVPKVNGSLFRIYRDQRFHFDEAPLKTRIGIIFWQGSGKRMQSASFYLHFDKETLFVAAGIRKFKPPLLAAYRAFIKDDARRVALAAIMSKMHDRGFELPEPRYKRLPRDFDAAMPAAHMALYDGVYAYTQTDAALLNDPKLIDTLYTHYEAMLPLHSWTHELTLHAAEA